MYEFTHRLHHEPWSKPSKNEEDYFHRKELEQRQELVQRKRLEAEAARAEEGERSCPRCGVALERAEVPENWADECPLCQGPVRHVAVNEVWVDRCSTCGGVWVDGPVFASLARREPHPLHDLFRDMLLAYSMGELPRNLGGEEHDR